MATPAEDIINASAPIGGNMLVISVRTGQAVTAGEAATSSTTR